ncbi:MAG: 50S ribosomal protein L22 [Eubacteriales bacterium]|nr:50S ribosomal protein L22 [Eubacteriales bacterium]
METKVAKAYLKQLRMSPRKVKIVLDLIRNKDVAQAAAILKNTNKIACESIEKLLKSAVANAEHNYEMDVEKLYVAECYVTPGILKNMKRVRPRAQGRAFRIIKRTSHITIALKERD